MTDLGEIEQTITALGEGTADYHDAMAMYLVIMARAQWRLADQARHREARQRARRERNPHDG